MLTPVGNDHLVFSPDPNRDVVSEVNQEYQLQEWSGKKVSCLLENGARRKIWQCISIIIGSGSTGRQPVLRWNMHSCTSDRSAVGSKAGRKPGQAPSDYINTIIQVALISGKNSRHTTERWRLPA